MQRGLLQALTIKVEKCVALAERRAGFAVEEG